MRLRDLDLSDIVVAVIGDQNLDIDYVGDLSGLMSREKESLPVHDTNIADVRFSGGGAANMVEILATLGVRVYPVGVWDTDGDHNSRDLLRIMMDNSGMIHFNHIIEVKGHGTPAFIKYYRPSGAHIFRANVSINAMTRDTEKKFIKTIRGLDGKADVVIVADYDEDGKGVITPLVLRAIEENITIPKIGISRRRIGKMFKYQSLIMNEEELALSKLSISELFRTNAEQIVLTLEGRGVRIYLPETVDGYEYEVSSEPLEGQIDTCGCGDAFAAAFAVCLAGKLRKETAMRYGNAAGRAEARKLYGAHPITVEEVEWEYDEVYG